MENEKRIISTEKQTPTDIIKEFAFGEKKSYYTYKEADVMLHTVLSLLTDEQRLALSKKMQRCDFYIKRREIGMNETKLRGLVSRKFDICRQKISATCKLCEQVLSYRKNK